MKSELLLLEDIDHKLHEANTHAPDSLVTQQHTNPYTHMIVACAHTHKHRCTHTRTQRRKKCSSASSSLRVELNNSTQLMLAKASSLSLSLSLSHSVSLSFVCIHLLSLAFNHSLLKSSFIPPSLTVSSLRATIYWSVLPS